MSNKKLFKPSIIALIISASLSLAPLSIQAAPNNDQAFMALADDYLDNYYFPTFPSNSTLLGMHTYDDKMEDYSRIGIKHQIATLMQYEAKVAAIDPDTLSEPIQGDRDLVLNNIRSNLLTLQTIRPWQKDPDMYSGGITNAIFVIMERPFAPVNDRLKLVIAREEQIPATLELAKTNLKNPPKIFTEIALQQLPGLISFFKNDVPAAFNTATDETLKKQFTASNDKVIHALESYQTWLTKTVLPNAHGDFRLGSETFRKKLQYDEMVDIPLDKLVAINLKNMQENKEAFAKLAKEIDPDKTPEQVLAELGANHPAPEKLLQSFTDTFNNLIQFIHDKHIITIPSDVKPIMEETPPFLRAITFASMDTPGPFEKNITEAYFNVTIPDKSWDPAKTSDFMKQFSWPVISSIAVHEAYPGHYVQFLWVPTVKDRVRQVFGAMSNAEGWAHYAEQMLIEEGLAHTGEDAASLRNEKMIKLGMLQEALLRNARFHVAVNMHTGNMSFDQAVDFFVKEGYQSPVVATVETKRGTSNPMYLYYTLGKLEILKLRADLEAKEGATFNLQKFHDDFMRQGFPPIKIVRSALLHDNSPTL